MISFEWDPRKDLSNQRKHGISFSEAQTAFYNESSTIYEDDEHSSDEERYILFGISAFLNLLAVVHCYRDDGRVIRIISARKATKTESKYYYDF